MANGEPYDDYRVRLIDEVKCRNHLWDPNHLDHNNPLASNAAWQEIGKRIGLSPSVAKQRFRGLRDTYRKRKKEILINNFNGYKVQPIKWKLYPHMTFLDSIMSFDVSENIGDMLDLDETGEGSAEEPDSKTTPPDDEEEDVKPALKRPKFLKNNRRYSVPPQSVPHVKYPFASSQDPASDDVSNKDIISYLEEFSERIVENCDADGLYGRYVAETLRKMPPSKRSKAKFMIQKVLYELDCDSEVDEVSGLVEVR